MSVNIYISVYNLKYMSLLIHGYMCVYVCICICICMSMYIYVRAVALKTCVCVCVCVEQAEHHSTHPLTPVLDFLSFGSHNSYKIELRRNTHCCILSDIVTAIKREASSVGRSVEFHPSCRMVAALCEVENFNIIISVYY